MMMLFEPKNILVTGGMGFIGSHFIEQISSNKQTKVIINLDKLTYASSKENIERLSTLPNHKFIQGDICDRNVVELIIKDYSIDTVVNFAAESHVDNSIVSPEEFIRTNIIGTHVLLDIVRRNWCNDRDKNSKYRFHHVSTDEVYGSITLDQPPVNETAIYDPSSPYSASKASSDHLVSAYYKTYGLPISMSHCSNNYGTYQHFEKFIPVVINCCLEKKPIPIYGDGSNIRDWVHVVDHCTAISTIIRKGRIGEKYNVPGNYEISNIDLAKNICNILDKIVPEETSYTSLLHYVDDRPGHDWRYSIDGKKIKTECGWSPQIKFQEGIKNTVKWYLSKKNKLTKIV